MEHRCNIKLLINVMVIILNCRDSSTDTAKKLSVLVGTDVTLSCLFDKLSKPVELNTLTVEWNMVDKHAEKNMVYTFEDGRARVSRESYAVDKMGLLRSDASLQIHNVTVGDEGLYTCRIITPVVYTETTLLEVLGISQLFRVCTEMALHNPDGTYSIRSGLTLHSSAVTDGQIRIICLVEHQTYSGPYNRSVTLTVRAPLQPFDSKLLAVTSVISVLLVFSVIGGTKLLRMYYCKENFYPQDILLEWSRNDGEEVRTITHFGPFSDHNRLYSVWSKIQLVMAREDERAIYTCRVYHSSFLTPGYKDISFHINTQGTPPNVMFIDCDPLCPLLDEECTLHLCIKDFCPKDVTVTWTKDEETVPSGVFNTPPSLNINGLYSMFSFLKITPKKDDQGSKLKCRVVHSAQREPEERVFILPNLHLADS
ncbi:hypothetical protein PAMP_017983 [Pampus punctatissimus]